MALDDTTYKNALLGLFNKLKDNPMTIEEYAAELAKITDAQIKTGEVPAGITVQTQGTAASQSGQTTSAGTII